MGSRTMARMDRILDACEAFEFWRSGLHPVARWIVDVLCIWAFLLLSLPVIALRNPERATLGILLPFVILCLVPAIGLRIFLPIHLRQFDQVVETAFLGSARSVEPFPNKAPRETKTIVKRLPPIVPAFPRVAVVEDTYREVWMADEVSYRRRFGPTGTQLCRLNERFGHLLQLPQVIAVSQ